jgi:hypothetical protein
MDAVVCIVPINKCKAILYLTIKMSFTPGNIIRKDEKVRWIN